MSDKIKEPDIRVALACGIVLGVLPLGGLAYDVSGSVFVGIVCGSVGGVLGAVLAAWCWLELTEEDHDWRQPFRKHEDDHDP